MAGLLDLSDADLSGFQPLEPRQYNAEVHEMGLDAVKNPGGKMPVGTPIIKVQYRLTDEGVANRRVFQQFVVPPNDYDKTKRDRMNGMIAKFFIALGTPEEEVKNKKFNPDFQDYIGAPCVITVGKEPKKDRDGNIVEGEFNNPVKAVKPAGSGASAPGSGGLL